jgi:pSer/pThr/pTyr-binding forkhead associated (FHA) protein
MLVAFKPDGARIDFRVRNERCVIGRDTEADLRIPVGTVSRQHCEVRIDDDEPRVRDLGSSNGTFLNGKRVTESIIDAGDHLRVGPTTFTVVIDGIPDVVTPPSEETGLPEGSSMMDSPRIGAADPANKPAPLIDPDDDDDEIMAPPPAAPAPAPKPGKKAAAKSNAPDDDEPAGEDPLSKMIERQDDDEDFDFDFFDDDEDDDDDDN